MSKAGLLVSTHNATNTIDAITQNIKHIESVDLINDGVLVPIITLVI